MASGGLLFCVPILTKPLPRSIFLGAADQVRATIAHEYHKHRCGIRRSLFESSFRGRQHERQVRPGWLRLEIRGAPRDKCSSVPQNRIVHGSE